MSRVICDSLFVHMFALSRIENHPDPRTLKRLQHTMADSKHLQNIKKDDEWHDVHGHPAEGPQGGMEMPQHPTHSVPDALPLGSSVVSSSTSQMKSPRSVSEATETDWERVSQQSVGIPAPLDDDYQASEADWEKISIPERVSIQSGGRKSLENIWTLGNDQQPPEDCLHHDTSGEAHVKSAYQVLKDHHSSCGAASSGIPDIYMLQQDERMRDLRLAMQSAWSTLDPPEQISCWTEDLKAFGVDGFVVAELEFLARKDKMGHTEAIRILAHFTRPGLVFKRGPSQWLHSAIEESVAYMDNWKHWESRNAHVGPTHYKASQHDPRPRQEAQDRRPAEVDVPQGGPNPVSDVPRGAANPWTQFNPVGLLRDPRAPKPSSASMKPSASAAGGPPPHPHPQQCQAASSSSGTPAPGAASSSSSGMSAQVRKATFKAPPPEYLLRRAQGLQPAVRGAPSGTDAGSSGSSGP